jgi:hypothetical protein
MLATVLPIEICPDSFVNSEQNMAPSAMKESPPIIFFSTTSRRPDKTLRTRVAVSSS